MRVTLDVWF